jgi:DNA-binding NarL/FixJ family response regulator
MVRLSRCSWDARPSSNISTYWRVDKVPGFCYSKAAFRGEIRSSITVSQLIEPIRIGIVDDHPVFRAGLRRVLERSGEMSVEWELADSGGLEAAFTRNPVDVILMDVELANGDNGLEATRAAVMRWPGLKVVVLSGSLNPETPQLAVDQGAAGFLAKDMPIPEMISRIREFASGRRRRSSRSPRDSVRLSTREHQVLVEIRRGRTNREIAATLGVSITTVNKHVQRLLKKLNVRNRAQAAAGQAEAPA